MIVSRGYGFFDPITEVASGARVALEASPGYFLGWYTVKSLLLVGVTAALAYRLGYDSAREDNRTRLERRR